MKWVSNWVYTTMTSGSVFFSAQSMNSEIYPKPKRKRKHERNPNTKQKSSGHQGNKKSCNQDKRFKYGNYNPYYGYRNKTMKMINGLNYYKKLGFKIKHV